ncbi:HlyD family secretion protein [Ketogulonicigenium vulgare]|uniref:Secretion protein HlyD family protein n=1 Tax=Ketogulonicigenium vulgare (strain WSH-001) TaxID=759362 RepID=F9YBU3_KETVW|nr:HlyD family secretion protein [Ketogulonicigenium vulgare]AEM42845.1 Secretion protein HlyD family protein [Ketogulonicigenium vulgare WSH-001]ALJ82727.1 hemolysin secretion protein D [Ketogulonicigenium vulgare]
MKRSVILPTAIVGALGLAGVLAVLFAWHLPPFSPALPSTENAYLRGKVTSLAPQLSGYISEVPVTDFQEVHAGDPIAVIDDRTYRERLAQAEATRAGADAALSVAQQNVRSAEATLHAKEAALVAAQIAVDTAQSARDRTSELRTRGVATDASIEQADLSLQNAVAQYSQAEATVAVQREQLAGAIAQISTAEANIASAVAAVALAQLDLEHTVIRAPADGYLGQVSARVGQYVSAGTALVPHVGKDLWVIANFNEGNLSAIHLGQHVTFSVDAMGGQNFAGTVESFSPAAASEFSLMQGTNATGNFTKIPQRVPVRITIDPDQAGTQNLVPGLSVNAKIQPL